MASSELKSLPSKLAQLAKLFPDCVSKIINDDQQIDYVINFEKLKLKLSDYCLTSAQQYQFIWPGKAQALQAVDTPCNKTLLACLQQSVNFDATANLYIEGDNLDALKLLQKAYQNQVKMIYIDPPYNTGNVFIYRDNFNTNKRQFALQNDLSADLPDRQLNGRFHAAWLNMLYPRLVLARNLLSDDGFIFISIDDKELANLRKLCDEIFGEENFITHFLWKKKATTSNVKGAEISQQVDYQLAYRKSPKAKLKARVTPKEQRNYPFSDHEGRYRTSIIEKKDSGSYQRATMKFPILGHKPRAGKRWQIGLSTAQALAAKNRFIFDGEKVLLKIYQFEDKDSYSAQPNLLDFCGSSVSAARATNTQLFNQAELFDNPKPLELLQHLIEIASDSDDLIMDFFAGSSSTAHAVLTLNSLKQAQRRFIMVQQAEPCQKKTQAFKAGYKTIAEIGQERIRRAGQQIIASATTQTKQADLGFRLFKLQEVVQPANERQLLCQLLVELGLNLALPISQQLIDGKRVMNYGQQQLLASFSGLTIMDEAFIVALASLKPRYMVFFNIAATDKAVINLVSQIFSLNCASTQIIWKANKT